MIWIKQLNGKSLKTHTTIRVVYYYTCGVLLCAWCPTVRVVYYCARGILLCPWYTTMRVVYYFARGILLCAWYTIIRVAYPYTPCGILLIVLKTLYKLSSLALTILGTCSWYHQFRQTQLLCLNWVKFTIVFRTSRKHFNIITR